MTDFNCDASLVVIEQAMTGRDTPQARPKAILLCMYYLDSIASVDGAKKENHERKIEIVMSESP